MGCDPTEEEARRDSAEASPPPSTPTPPPCPATPLPNPLLHPVPLAPPPPPSADPPSPSPHDPPPSDLPSSSPPTCSSCCCCLPPFPPPPSSARMRSAYELCGASRSRVSAALASACNAFPSAAGVSGVGVGVESEWFVFSVRQHSEMRELRGANVAGSPPNGTLQSSHPTALISRRRGKIKDPWTVEIAAPYHWPRTRQPPAAQRQHPGRALAAQGCSS